MKEQVNETFIKEINQQANTEPIKKKRKIDSEEIVYYSTIKLLPKEFQSWSKDQVCSLLCTPHEKGGAQLPFHCVKPLYDQEFCGAFLYVIVDDIKSKGFEYSLRKQEGYLNVIEKPLLRQTLEWVLKWCEMLLNTRLYHLWSNEQLKETLCKPTDEGGANLSEEQFNEIIQPKLLLSERYRSIEKVIDKISHDEKCPIHSLINRWLESIELHARNDIYFSDDDNYWFEKVTHSNMKPSKVYEMVHERMCKQTCGKDIEADIESIVKECNVNFKIGTFNLLENPSFTRPLPILKLTNRNILAKHHLPYFQSLHINSKNDQLLQNPTENTIILISPSGMGKTSLMIRKLCQVPGIYLVGATNFEMESSQTTDYAVKSLASLFSSRMEAFAFVRHGVILLLVTKLLHIKYIIEKEDLTEYLPPFENNLFALIAFNQSNRNTKMEKTLFDKLYSKLKHVNIDRLRLYAQSLITNIKSKTNSDKFVIGVDEAHILEEYSKYRYISYNGTERGLLTILTEEITLLNDLNIYAGTSFSVDVSQIVKSTFGKSEINLVLKLYEFEYIDNSKAIEYIKRHVNTQESQIIPNNQQVRIRQLALCLEHYINYLVVCNPMSLKTCFIASTRDMIRDIKEAVKKFTTKSTRNLIESYENCLIKYILHYEHGEVVGSTFSIPKIVANHLVNTGIACPINNTDTMEILAIDSLSYETAIQLLDNSISFKKYKKMDLAKYLMDHTKLIQDAFCVALCTLDDKQFSTIVKLFENVVNEDLKRKMENVKFVCKKVLTPIGYMEYCKENNWIEKNITGEQLYFEYTLQYPKRVSGILFRSSNNEAILALEYNPPINSTEKIDSRELVFLRFKYILEKRNKSTSPELMFNQIHEKYLKIFALNSLFIVFHPTCQESDSKTKISDLDVAFLTLREEFSKLFGEEFSESLYLFLEKRNNKQSQNKTEAYYMDEMEF